MLSGIKQFLTASCTLLLVLGSLAQAQLNASGATDKAATPQVQAQLVASVSAVVPGSEIYLGVNQQIIPHWHTYWINPGDSGNATTINWTLSQGVTASEIIWPAPSRFSMGSITNYAYENNVTLLSKITVPPNLVEGDAFTANALVDWLVCAEECIPQQVELALSLPVVANTGQVGEGSPLIAEAQARLPVASPWEVRALQTAIDPETAQGKLQLQIGLTKEQLAQVKDIWFYPYDWGRIRQSDAQLRKDLTDGLQLEIPTGEAPISIGEKLTGVLVIQEQQGIARGYEINVVVQALAGSGLGQNSNANEFSIGFVGALFFALLGGIILNLMPCVFPVLSIKALSLVSHANQSPTEIRRQGYVYTLGVLASFAALALLLIVLKAGGNQVGWGFQFQSPIFVLLVAWLLFAVGLSLSGVFFIGGSVAGMGSSLTEKPGYSGSFFTGVLATVVATPCTAPFMAAALGYALAQPALQLLAIFLSLGFGLALPYLLLSCWPRLQRWLPRPGLWMERAKQLLAFPMYAAVIWLVWVLVQQVGVDAVVIALGGMLLIALAAWIYDSSRTASNKASGIGSVSALALVLLAVGFGSMQVNSTALSAQQSTVKQSTVKQSTTQKAADANWEAYSDERLQALLAEGKPVFLNFTASWCISCLVNERIALSTDAVKQQFKQQGITYLKGDWTNRDPQITTFLKKFNRSGVPLYVFYPAGQADSPKELPQILTPDLVVTAVSDK